jgi:hypothetical protein
MVGPMREQVNESDGVGGGSKGDSWRKISWLPKELLCMLNRLVMRHGVQWEQAWSKSLSPLSWRVIARHSGHMVPLDRPDVIVAEITRLVDYLRAMLAVIASMNSRRYLVKCSSRKKLRIERSHLRAASPIELQVNWTSHPTGKALLRLSGKFHYPSPSRGCRATDFRRTMRKRPIPASGR